MHLKLGRTFHFGVLMPKPSQDSHYWSLPVRGMTRAQNELASRRVRVSYFFYDRYSDAYLERARQDVIQTGLDGLLIAPVFSGAFGKFLLDISPELPYVFFDSSIPDANPVSFIGQDSFQSGVLSARLMQMIIKAEGTVALIKVLPEDTHILDRVNGFLSHCRKCPGMETLVYELNAHKNSGLRNKLFERILSENPDLKGIFVSNACTHQIAEHIKLQKLSKRIHVIGYDLIEENVRFLRDGEIDFLISQQSERQGYEGLYALYRHVILNQAVEKNIMMQLDIVAKENVDYYCS